jgi:NAD(P)H-dependent FMN reductase
MITVISGTNRKESISKKVAKQVYELLKENTSEEIKFLSLDELPDGILHVDMYGSENQSKELALIQDEYIVPAYKFYFVIPEYNGSFPGILKLFIDACSVRKYKESFHGAKKAALLGIASGRAGNLRGLEHFSGVLNYLQITVMPSHQPIGTIEKMLDDQGNIKDEGTIKAIENQVLRFINY